MLGLDLKSNSSNCLMLILNRLLGNYIHTQVYIHIHIYVCAYIHQALAKKGAYITGSDGNLISFKMFKILFPKSSLAALYTIKNISVILKTSNQSHIKQLGVCTVRL